MPFALFCHDARLSKSYPTEDDVWELARQSGLVVDGTYRRRRSEPRPVLDNDYEIRACPSDPQEDPARNKAEAENAARYEPQFGL
jgi:hypothetical protein